VCQALWCGLWTVDYSRLDCGVGLLDLAAVMFARSQVTRTNLLSRCTSFGRSAIKSIWQFFALLHGNEVS